MNVALIENLNEHSYKMGWKEVSERYERFLRDLQRIFHKRAWLHLDYQLNELQTFRSVRIELRFRDRPLMKRGKLPEACMTCNSIDACSR